MTTPFALPAVAFFGRTFEEYLQMFSLNHAALRTMTVLDCPSGPASFVAEAAAQGIQVIGCDPLYSLDADALHARARQNIDDSFAVLGKLDDPVKFRNPEQFRQDKDDALEAFILDYRTGRGSRYVPAALPTLPFNDDAFELVLSSNLLFCYSSVADGGILENDTFDLSFHHRAITELARVAKREIRLAPTHAMQQPPRRHPYLAAVMEELGSLGFDAALEPSSYDDGFDPFVEVLVARARSVSGTCDGCN